MGLLKANERIDYIYNDDLKIIQEQNEFAFSLDSILLGAWANKKIKDRFKVVDLCAGNGACSLYMSYFNRAHYDLVEIQPEVADQAQRSIELNHLENRMQVHLGDAKEVTKFLPKDSYDLVVLNPPYFKVAAGHKVNPDSKKAIARHEIKITLQQAIQAASQLLKMKGKLILVHRPERLAEIANDCSQADLSLKKIQPFVSRRGKDSNLIIVQAVKHTSLDGLVLADAIEVHDQAGNYQEQIEGLLREKPEVVKKAYYFYVLLCSDGSFYGGFTNDLKHRLKMHNSGKGAKYTKTRRPVKMIYHEQFNDKRLALKREYWFKHHDRAWKEKFLRAHQAF